MINEKVVKLNDSELEEVYGGGKGFYDTFGLDETEVKKGRSNEFGKLTVACIVIPTTVALSTLVKWGCDRLTKYLDKKIDAPKNPRANV